MNKIKILIVEDDISLAEELEIFLMRWGYTTFLIHDFSNVLNEYKDKQPDLILMDINLPYFDGFYWCSKIREHSLVPIIYISSRNDDNDKIMAIAQGGDDYVEKPFNLIVLKAKIEAILRRTYEYKISQKSYITEDIIYDHSTSSISIKNDTIELTKSENIIIKCLMDKKSKIVSRPALMEELWSTDEFISDAALTVLISRLRSKLKDRTGTEIIYTKKGQGYYIR